MHHTIQHLIAEILKEFSVPAAEIEISFPENAVHGEYTTNVAMKYAKHIGKPPREIAQKIVDQIKTDQKNSVYPWLSRVEIAGPGFINFIVSDTHLGSVLDGVLKNGQRYGMVVKGASEAHKSENNPSGKHGKTGTDKQGKSRHASSQKYVDKRGINDTSLGNSAGIRGQNTDTASFGKKTIMVEFAHPNTHKAFHIGHLRNITTGETVVRLLESQGNRVIRANYQGDVGMHIAKALYALLSLDPYKTDVHTITGVKNRVEFLGKAYAAGSKMFEEDDTAKGIIKDLNALVYASAQRYAKEVSRDPGTTDYVSLVTNHVHPLEEVYRMWKETRQWSLDYFETIYKRVGTHYDRYYFESECLAGVDIAKDAVKKGVLKESDGAIIFDGKPHGIDTRVFVNSLGLPTYEGKELKLASIQSSEQPDMAKLIHVLGPEQVSFTKVTFKAEELLGILKPNVQLHLTYGWVKLKHGKMSSRTGNVVLGAWLIDEVKRAVKEIINGTSSKQIDPVRQAQGEIDVEETAEALAIAAIKYAFLKVSTNQEIAFDLKESISLTGDSGPYLMYTYARAKSVLRKAGFDEAKHSSVVGPFNSEERAVVRLISQFPDIVKSAADSYAPNILCTHLFQLAQTFNLFYTRHQIGDVSQRQVLTAAAAATIRNGLYPLGIRTIERM